MAGETLQDYLRRTGPLTPSEAISLFTQLLRELSEMHAQGVTHRDVKPGNILVDESGDSPVVTITDFGLSLVQAGTANTRVDEVVGMPPYMAPEAIAGGVVGPSADMFAAGVVLYEMLAGRPPFTGSLPTAVLYQTLNSEPPPIEGLQDDDGSLWGFLKQLLDKDPTKRLSADQALAELERIRFARPREVGQGNVQIN